MQKLIEKTDSPTERVALIARQGYWNARETEEFRLTAPNARPLTICRCINIMKTTIGSIIPTAAADSVQ